MKVPSQQQLDDEEIEEIWAQMKAERQPKKKSKIGRVLRWLFWKLVLIGAMTGFWWFLFWAGTRLWKP